MTAPVIPIHALYLGRALQLRRERRSLLDRREYRAAVTRGELAFGVERQGIEIRRRMDDAPWLDWPPAPDAA
jgi:hypothetical protein